MKTLCRCYCDNYVLATARVVELFSAIAGQNGVNTDEVLHVLLGLVVCFGFGVCFLF